MRKSTQFYNLTMLETLSVLLPAVFLGWWFANEQAGAVWPVLVAMIFTWVSIGYSKRRHLQNIEEILHDIKTAMGTKMSADAQSNHTPVSALKSRGNSALDPILNDLNLAITEARGNCSLFSQVVNSIAEQASNVSAASKNIVNQAGLQKSGVQSVVDMLEQLQGVFAIASETAAEASEVATASEKEGNAGKLVVTEAMSSVMFLSDSIVSAGAVVKRLGEESQSINSVVSVIKGVAEQTNLLALNAAIEAARAGEQGRGFAVVADEVRTLASKTQTYTSEIERIIEGLQSLVKTATQSIENTVELSAKSDELIESVVVSYADLVGALNSLKAVGGKLSSATLSESETANNASSKLVEMKQQSEMTEFVANTVFEASEELNALSEKLNGLLKRSSSASL